MKETSKMWWFVGGGVILVGLLLSWQSIFPPQNASASIVARTGLHWHPQIEMYVRGEKYEIPANMGLAGVHKPIHTHEDLPLIHLEFSGLVEEQDIMLGEFFKNWGRDMRSFGENVRMTVNGVENTDLERYIMRDGDQIRIDYD